MVFASPNSRRKHLYKSTPVGSVEILEEEPVAFLLVFNVMRMTTLATPDIETLLTAIATMLEDAAVECELKSSFNIFIYLLLHLHDSVL